MQMETKISAFVLTKGEVYTLWITVRHRVCCKAETSFQNLLKTKSLSTAYGIAKEKMRVHISLRKEAESLIFKYPFSSVHFTSLQSLSCVRFFATPWIAARQASLSSTNSQSSLRLTSIESVMPSSHLILCRPLLLLSPIPPSIRVFSNESTLHMRWPKYWSFSFSIIPSKEIPGLRWPQIR